MLRWLKVLMWHHSKSPPPKCQSLIIQLLKVTTHLALSKKLEVQATAKVVLTAGAKPVGGRAAKKKKRAKNDAEEIVQASDEELPQEPKPKKAKVKV
jgi:hypothetical protein